METWTLDQIPPPPFKGVIHLMNREEIDAVLDRCTILGWRWQGWIINKAVPKEPANEWRPAEIDSFFLYFEDRMLAWNTVLLAGYSEIRISLDMSIPAVNLKTVNTKPEATHCVKCKTQLVNPCPGFDSMKHCPKCEP